MYRPPGFTDDKWLAYKYAVSQPDRKWSAELTIYLDDGTILNLNEDDIVISSLFFKEQSTCTSNIMIGSTFANSLDFVLVNDDGRFRNYNFYKARVDATVSLYVPQIDEWANIKLGTFVVLEAGKKYTTIPIKCMDKMCLFNRQLEEANPIFPSTLKLLFQKICALLGVEYSTVLYDEIPNINIAAFDITKITCRDFLSHLACVMGVNFRMSRNNVLEGVWYQKSDFVTSPDIRMNIVMDDLDIHPTAVSIMDWNSKKYTVKNADNSYLFAFDVNPLIQNEVIANSILLQNTSILTSMQYKIYECEFSGDPTVQAGDFVIHNDVLYEQQIQSQVESIVMVHEYKLKGVGKIAAIGQTPEQDRQLTAQAKKIIEAEIKASKDLNEGLTSAQQTMLNQSLLFSESLALFCGIKYNEKNQVVGYYMASEDIFPADHVIASDDSNVDPRKDCYVWAYNLGGIGVSDTGYFGVYSGFTRDKSIIARTITADWIRTGVISSKDSTLQIDLQLGKQTLQALDGWGQTVLDGIGAIFNYWNKNVTNPENQGHPLLAYLEITADADELESTQDKTVADLKLVWSTYDGKMHTSMGHSIYHTNDGTSVSSFTAFEIKSNNPIRISPSLYYDEALLFDNIIMRRTNLVSGNSGVDFLIAPNSIKQNYMNGGN